MNVAFNVDLNFSLFGLVIFGLIAWGGYRGYLRGGIIMGLSLFALIAAFVICGILTMFVYKYFWKNGSNVPNIFGAVVLGISFVGAIWFSHYVLVAVKERTGGSEMDNKNKIFGAVFGVIKFFIIVAVYSVVILNLDRNGKFLPEREANSKFMNGISWVLVKGFRPLKMDYHVVGPQELPQDINNNNNKTNNNNNNTNTNKDNNTNNVPNNNDLIKDVKDDKNF